MRDPEGGWYCGFCRYGPNNTVLQLHCTDCGCRREDYYTRYVERPVSSGRFSFTLPYQIHLPASQSTPVHSPESSSFPSLPQPVPTLGNSQLISANPDGSKASSSPEQSYTLVSGQSTPVNDGKPLPNPPLSQQDSSVTNFESSKSTVTDKHDDLRLSAPFLAGRDALYQGEGIDKSILIEAYLYHPDNQWSQEDLTVYPLRIPLPGESCFRLDGTRQRMPTSQQRRNEINRLRRSGGACLNCKKSKKTCRHNLNGHRSQEGHSKITSQSEHTCTPGENPSDSHQLSQHRSSSTERQRSSRRPSTISIATQSLGSTEPVVTKRGGSRESINALRELRPNPLVHSNTKSPDTVESEDHRATYRVNTGYRGANFKEQYNNLYNQYDGAKVNSLEEDDESIASSMTLKTPKRPSDQTHNQFRANFHEPAAAIANFYTYTAAHGTKDLPQSLSTNVEYGSMLPTTYESGESQGHETSNMERDTHTTSFYSRHPESHEQNANFSEFQVEGLNVRPSDPDPGVLADSRSMSPYWSELGSRFRQERDWQPSTMEATFPPYTREIFLTSACFEEEDQQTPEDLVQFGFGSGSNNPSTIQVHSSSSGNLINTPSSNSQLETPAPSDIVTQYQLRQSPPDTYPHYSANESYLSQNNLSLVISRAFGPVANTSSLCTQAEVEDLDVNEFMRKDLLLDRDLYAMGGAFYLTPRNVGMGHFFLSNDSIFRDMEMQNRYLVAGRPAENVDRRRYGVYTGYQSGIPSLEPNLADQENQSSIEVGNTSLSPGHEDVPVDISIEGLTEAQRLEHDAWGEPDPEFYEKMKRDSHELFGEG